MPPYTVQVGVYGLVDYIVARIQGLQNGRTFFVSKPATVSEDFVRNVKCRYCTWYIDRMYSANAIMRTSELETKIERVQYCGSQISHGVRSAFQLRRLQERLQFHMLSLQECPLLFKGASERRLEIPQEDMLSSWIHLYALQRTDGVISGMPCSSSSSLSSFNGEFLWTGRSEALLHVLRL